MAIIIPSRNIFKIENPKIRDNVIDKIEVQSTSVSEKAVSSVAFDDDISITYSNFTEISGVQSQIFEDERVAEWTNSTYSSFTADSQGIATMSNVVACYAQVSYGISKLSEIEIQIPKKSGNKYINSVSKKDIQITFSGNLQETSKTGTFPMRGFYEGAGESVRPYIYKTGTAISWGSPSTTQKLVSYQIGDTFDKEIEKEYKNVSCRANASVEVKKQILVSTPGELVPYKRVNPEYVTIEEYQSYFLVKLKVISAITTEEQFGDYSSATVVTDGSVFKMTVQSIIKEYTPTKAHITINGTTVELDFVDNTRTIPTNSTGTKPFSVENNELLQYNSVYMPGVQQQNAIYRMYYGTYQHYKDGKETATITCDISSYYDENYPFPLVSEKYKSVPNREVAISSTQSSRYNYFETSDTQPRDLRLSFSIGIQTVAYLTIKAGTKRVAGSTLLGTDFSSSSWILPMTFKMYDEVIPMVYGADGKERPMSLNADGTPKIFKVLGVELSHNGVVRQKLSLQEV